MNPVRVEFVRSAIAQTDTGKDGEAGGRAALPFHRQLQGMRILDVGCGGGILTEALARLGADLVLGLDPAPESVRVATAHAQLDPRLSGVVRYRQGTLDDLVVPSTGKGGEDDGPFDAVCALEVVEHVPDVRGFVAQLGALVKPGKHVFLSTLNRTWKSYAMAIVGAEYVARVVPPGTHDWNKFVTPDELRAALHSAGFQDVSFNGMVLCPRSGSWALSGEDLAVNYIAHARLAGS